VRWIQRPEADMYRLPFGVLLVVTVLAGIARAADSDLIRTQAAIADDQSALNEAHSQRNSILQVIHEDDAHAAALRARLAGGEADLPRIQKDLSAAKAGADERRQAAEPERVRYEAARDHLEAAKAHARTDFESGADFRAIQNAATTAHDALGAAEQAAILPLTRSPTYRDLQSEIDKDASRVDYFHRAGPAFFHEEQAASSMLQEETDHLNNLKGQFINSYPDANRAHERSASADAALAKAQADIEQRLLDVPEVVAAAHALQVELQPYGAAMAVLHAAEARVAPIQKAYQQTTDGMAADRKTLGDVEEDRAQARAELSRLDADIDRIASDLTAGIATDAQARAGNQQPPAVVAPSDTQPVVYWSDPLADLPSVAPPSIFSYNPIPAVEDDGALASDFEPAPIFIEGAGFLGRHRRIADRDIGRHRLDQMSFRRMRGLAGGFGQQNAGDEWSPIPMAKLQTGQASLGQQIEPANAFPQIVGRPFYSTGQRFSTGGGTQFRGGEQRGGFERSSRSFQGRTWNSAPEAQHGQGRASGGGGRR
jgi:hypothetical protein